MRGLCVRCAYVAGLAVKQIWTTKAKPGQSVAADPPHRDVSVAPS